MTMNFPAAQIQVFHAAEQIEPAVNVAGDRVISSLNANERVPDSRLWFVDLDDRIKSEVRIIRQMRDVVAVD